MKLNEVEKLISDARSLEADRSALLGTIRKQERELIRRIQGTWRFKDMENLSGEEALKIYLAAGGVDADVTEAATALRDSHKKWSEIDSKLSNAVRQLVKWQEAAGAKRIRELNAALEKLVESARKAIAPLAKNEHETDAAVSQLSAPKDLRFRIRSLTNITIDPAPRTSTVYSASVLLNDLKSPI